MIPRLAPLAVLLALAAAAVTGFAAPAARPRAAGPAEAARAAPAGARPAVDAADACGTRLEASFELAERRAAAALAAPLPTPNSADTAGIGVLEDDGTFFYLDKSGNSVLDVAAVTHAWYRTHDDSAEFLAIYLASGLQNWLGSPTAAAAAWPIRNAIDGIGLSRFDLGEAFGSPQRLETVLTMNGLHVWPDDPDEVRPGDTFSSAGILAHEFGHRWSSYVFVDSAGVPSPALLGRDLQHWGFFFDCDSSFMEGCDWTAVAADSFVTTGATTTFGALDQYLMGLRAKSEMDSLLVVNDPTDLDPPGVYVPWSIPAVGVSCDGRATRWTVGDIERVHGPRVPDAAGAPHAWRVAFALVTPRGQGATAFDLAKLGALRARFPGLVAAATGGRGAVDVSLPSRPGRLVIVHEPLSDTEDTGDPRRVAARVAREAGAQALPGSPAVTLHWRPAGGGEFAAVPMAPAGADSFAADLPPASGAIEYWIAAGHPSLAVAQAPADGASGPYAYVAGPDPTPPVVAHVPVPAQANTRMPQVMLARVTDNLGVDTVWCEVAVNGGAPAALPVTRAGRDSFTIALGAGLGNGQRVAYRFVARDASLAGNLGWSNAAFDTLRVVRDILDDFENPSGYVHLPSLWSYRDPWAPDARRSSPAGGTAWHFGSGSDLPYPPHADAVLFLPWVYGIEPGTTLSFDSWHDFEQEDESYAWDGFRVEVQPWGVAAGVPVEPTPGTTHLMLSRTLSIPRLAACWSGQSPGWVTRTLDLSPWAPGPVRLLVRACADDWIGGGGLWIDRVRVHHPGGAPLGVPAAGALASCGRAWPNPTRGTLRLPLSLARATGIEWSLHDLQGRRVATLWRGDAGPGPHELAADAPASLAPGLYFARLRAAGREMAAQRIAIVR